MKTIHPRALISRAAKQITMGLALAAAMMFLRSDALAASNGTSILHLKFQSAMTNTGVDPLAGGNLSGNVSRQGNADNQQLTIALVHLSPNTTYRLEAIIGGDAGLTSVTEFLTDSKGAARISYSDKSQGNSGAARARAGKLPLPSALNPLRDVSELDIVNGSSQVILRADLTDPDKLQYLFKRRLDNTGFIAAAEGSLQIKATTASTKFRLKASGLVPSTNYVLTINGTAAQTVTSSGSGELDLKALPPGAPDVLDIHSVGLTDTTGNLILTVGGGSGGMGIPVDDQTNVTRPTVISTVPADAASNVPIANDISATFSEAMDPLTITTATFTLTQAGTPVAGTVSYAGVTATFDPTSALAAGATYTATITTGAQDLAGTSPAADYVWTFTTEATADTFAPSVSFTIPTNGATGVPIGGNIAIVFTEPMDPLTILPVTFTLKQGGTPVAGTVTYAGITATFNPAASLAASTTYTARITTGATDPAGNPLANDFSWTFTTGATADTTRPTVRSTVPANAATDVAIGGNIAVAFSEAMDPLTINAGTFTLKQGSTPVVGTVSYAGVAATFNPTSTLALNTIYTATITTGAKDLAGNALLSDFSWSFTTGVAADIVAPSVRTTVPFSGANNVALNQSINVTFSEAMNPLTINTVTFKLVGQGAIPVTGTVTYDVLSNIATFNPADVLASLTTFTATITSGARDLAGNPIAPDYVWTFTTAATSSGQSPVALGASTTFAVLAGSTVTNVGGTTVDGDLGVSPGSAVTGFVTVDGGPGTVNGTIYTLTPGPAANAQSDLTLAFNNAAGRTVDSIAVAGNIGGQTLAPGLYKSTSSLEISSGDLTLDAQGNANGVFIFQIASTLTTTSGRQVILMGGAMAANVFWQVGSSATLGTDSVFKGTIMADQSITLTSGAALEGRALARSGAVTLGANVITVAMP